MLFVYILVLVVLSSLGLLLSEGFQSYKMLPFNEQKTGRDPLNYYTMPAYRKPYRYPFTFYKSYPTPHMAHYEQIMGSG